MSREKAGRMRAARHLGFAGMTAAGYTHAEAWQKIRDDLIADPVACGTFEKMALTPEGRSALEASRQAWARYGLGAPWEDLPGPAGDERRSGL